MRPSPEDRLKQLMVEALAGDGRSYQALLIISAERLRRYFGRRLTTQPAQVEDLVQETLMAIHHKRASYSPALPFSAWLHGIARYKLIDFLRREGRQATVPLESVAEIRDPHDIEAEALAAIDVEALLARLPDKQATAIRLTRIEGLSVREASDRSGQSEPSVKVNVHRGLGRLIAKIQGRGD